MNYCGYVKSHARLLSRLCDAKQPAEQNGLLFSYNSIQTVVVKRFLFKAVGVGFEGDGGRVG